MRAGPRRRQGRTATTPACSATGQGSPSPQVTGGVARMGEKVRMLSSCRLRCWWPFVLLSAGLSTWVWAQPASIRTVHCWLRVQRLSWPGVMPRSGVRGIGGANRVDHDQRRTLPMTSLVSETLSPRCRRFVSEGRLAHYAYRSSPPGWCCRALPHRPRPSLRSRAPRHDAEAALQDHGPTHGVVASRFAHRGVPWDDGGQIC